MENVVKLMLSKSSVTVISSLKTEVAPAVFMIHATNTLTLSVVGSSFHGADRDNNLGFLDDNRLLL